MPLIYPTKNGYVSVPDGLPIQKGDDVLLVPTSNGYVTPTSYITPQPGDEVILHPTNNGYVTLNGLRGCDPSLPASYWQWENDVPMAAQLTGYITTYEWFISSKEFKAISFDFTYRGALRIWAFGELVFEGNGDNVEFNETYYSDNPCGYRLVRVMLSNVYAQPYACLKGTFDVLLGQNGGLIYS